MNRRIDRRHFLQGAAALMSAALTGCASDMKRKCEPLSGDLELANRELGLEDEPLVYRIGAPEAPSVMLLHELPGLTWCDVDAACRLSHEGKFAVYIPVMFGSLGQNSVARGYFQSCLRDAFVCGKLATRSPVQDWLAEVFQAIDRKYHRPVGAVGMCLTGSFPLALLGAGAQAAVLCQPTIPFTTLLGKPIGGEKFDLGVSQMDLECALKSAVPILAMHFESDPKCPPQRLAALEGRFGARVAVAKLKEKGHSTLAGDCNPDAFEDTVQYLRVRLGLETQPKRMRVALLAGCPCEITAEGWREMPTEPVARR